jgi:membrane-associated phospholipid phosphatase
LLGAALILIFEGCTLLSLQNLGRQLRQRWIKQIHLPMTVLMGKGGASWLVLYVSILSLLAVLSHQVLNRSLLAWEPPVLWRIHQLSHPVLDVLMVGITGLNDPPMAISITVVVFCFLAWQRHRLEAAVFLLETLGGGLLSPLLKLVFNRPRPTLWPTLISETTFSYPSGHALGSVVLYGFLAYLFSTLYPRYTGAFYGVAVPLILAIGFSRMYLGVHWPSDVLGGYSIGFLWVMMCISLLRFLKIRSQAKF